MSGRKVNQGVKGTYEDLTKGTGVSNGRMRGILGAPAPETASSQAGTSTQNDDKAAYDVDAPYLAGAFQGYHNEHLRLPGSLPRRHFALSSATLEPVSVVQTPHLVPLGSPDDIPLLKQIDLEPARKDGVYGYTPQCGPVGCKFFVFIRHTSALAVRVLSSLKRRGSTPFYIDFGGTKVPCVPHEFHLDVNHANSEWGRDREILVGLVPDLEGRQEVDVKLYVEKEGGASAFNLLLGKFMFDATVPLRRYMEVEWRGKFLVQFLEMERPSTGDVLVPKMFMVSELEGGLATHHISNVTEVTDASHTNSSEGPMTRFRGAPILEVPPGSRNAKRSNSEPSPRAAKIRRKPSAPKTKALQITPTPGSGLRQHYVTISFTHPPPSYYGMHTLRHWSVDELDCKRRLVAFTCETDHNNVSGAFTCRPVPNMASSPPRSYVLSCIYVVPNAKNVSNTCIVTSFDFINLIKWMINCPLWFNVEERNRLRRNLENFGPTLIDKEWQGYAWHTHKQITGYTNPKPWNIAKNFKVFNWNQVESMMRNVMRKYSVLIPEDHPVHQPTDEELDREVDKEIEEEWVQAEIDLVKEIALQEGMGEEWLDLASKMKKRGQALDCTDGEAFGEEYFKGCSNTSGMDSTVQSSRDTHMENSAQSTMDEERDQMGEDSPELDCEDEETFDESDFQGHSDTGGIVFDFCFPNDKVVDNSMGTTTTSQWYSQMTGIGRHPMGEGDIFGTTGQRTFNHPGLSMFAQERTDLQDYYEVDGHQTAEWASGGVQQEGFHIFRQQPRAQIQTLNSQTLSVGLDEASPVQTDYLGHSHQSGTQEGSERLIQGCHLAEELPEETESMSRLRLHDDSHSDGVHGSRHHDSQ